ncbi:MAG: Ni/Fe hydrogenase [Bacteroidetes bacterium]|nr:MAG: Ni/Fe hydrogenase [Bacteroidota bacterium]
MNAAKMATRQLLLGIGNSGRADDGLGWAFAEAFSGQTDLFAVELRYQLQIEDALLISTYQRVVIVDASVTVYDQGYSWSRCQPRRTDAFTTHQLAPATVVYLAQELYQCTPEVYVLAISGVDWELRTGLSPTAERNLAKARAFFGEKWEGDRNRKSEVGSRK